MCDREFQRHFKLTHQETFESSVIVAPFKTQRPRRKKDVLSGGVRCKLIFTDHAHLITHLKNRHPEYDVKAFIERFNQKLAMKRLQSAECQPVNECQADTNQSSESVYSEVVSYGTSYANSYTADSL